MRKTNLHKTKKITTLLLSLLINLTAVPINANAEVDTSYVTMNLVYDGANHKYNAKQIHLVVDGEEIKNLAMPPIIFQDYTLVPAKEVFEKMGAVVSWNDVKKEAYVGMGDNLVIIKANSTLAEVNGKQLEMQIPAKIINDKTMIPLSFVSQSLGFSVKWEDTTRTVAVMSDDYMKMLAFVGVNTATPTPAPVQTPSPSPAQPPVTVTPQPTALAKDVSTQPLTEEKHSETKITDVVLPTAQNGYSFAINATSPISKVNKFLLNDNRLVVDIYNAEMAVKNTAVAVQNSPVSKLRVGQNELTPVKITRVVFELNSTISYKVGFSQDRKQVIISFEKNEITGVGISSDGTNDKVSVTFTGQPSVKLQTLTNPYRVIIDAPLTSIKAVAPSGSGKYVSAVRVAQFDEQTARVVLDMAQDAKYSLDISGNTATVTLSEPTYKNVQYDMDKSAIIIDKKGSGTIGVSNITHNDQYSFGKYILTLPSDMSNILGYGEIPVGNDYISSVIIQQNGTGQTEIVINEKQILAFVVQEDDTRLYIKPMHPKQVYSKIVMIDPGHGGVKAPGVVANGITEKDLNFAIALKLKKLLESQNDVKAYFTRTTDVNVELMDRAYMANKTADLFVSIHNNSSDENKAANGTEVYYYKHDNDNVIGVSSQQVAEIMQKNLISSLGSTNRKVKSNSYIVIKHATIPAVLCEVGFVTNAEEAAKLKTEEYQQKAAEGIYKGILETFATYNIVRQ